MVKMSFGLALSAAASLFLPAVQAHWHHQEEQSTNALFRRREIEQAKKHHAEKMTLNARQYRELATMTRSLHAEHMTLMHELARRETARDVWLQRFSVNDTMIVMSGLMFGCASMNLGQGTFGPSLSPAMVTLHGVSLGLAVLCLGVSVWVCFVVQVRLGDFGLTDTSVVYSCGRTHLHFNEFFSCHCEHLRQVAKVGFIAGSLMVLVSALVLLSAQFIVEHNSISAIVVVAAVIGLGIAAVLVGEKIWPSRTHSFAYDFGGLSQVTLEAAKSH